MKLDRNINEDGRGKYALIHTRRLPAYDYDALVRRAGARWARENGDEKTAVSLYEYAAEIHREADIARDYPNKKLPD